MNLLGNDTSNSVKPVSVTMREGENYDSLKAAKEPYPIPITPLSLCNGSGMNFLFLVLTPRLLILSLTLSF